MRKNGVLCAIDVNDYDQNVIDLAANMAEQFGADLDLLHVTLFPDPTNAAWPAYLGAPNELILDHRNFKKVRTCVDVRLHRHHVSGLPVEQIVGFVERNAPRLLVMGTHAQRGIHRILGSHALKVMRQVSCPVLILRQQKTAPMACAGSKTVDSR